LIDTTWALIAHERLASIEKRFGLFSKENPLVSMLVADRVAAYAAFGKRLDLYRPDESAAELAVEIEKGNFDKFSHRGTENTKNTDEEFSEKIFTQRHGGGKYE
jgi:hypothetical protein